MTVPRQQTVPTAVDSLGRKLTMSLRVTGIHAEVVVWREGYSEVPALRFTLDRPACGALIDSLLIAAAEMAGRS